MNKYLDYPADEHQVRLMAGDPKALAFAWIQAYAEQLSSGGYEDEGHTVTAEELIDTASENVQGNSEWGGEYITKGGLLEGVGVDKTFWDKLSILMDTEIPEEKRNDFFSCSC